jgi:hypothetical protein
VTEIRLSTGGDIVAALPHLLGFHPAASLVLIAGTRRGSRYRLGMVQRLDVPLPRGVDVTDVAGDLMRNLIRDNADNALLVIIDAIGPAGHRPLVEAISESASNGGVDLAHALWAAGTNHGCEWRCYADLDCHGVVPDPDSSVLAATAVSIGRVTFTNREDVIAQLAPVDPDAVLRRAHALQTAPVTSSAEKYGVVLLAVANACHGKLPSRDEQFVMLADAVADPLVRDAALGTALDVSPADMRAVRELWAALVRGTPPSHRAAPAVLLAFAAWQDGNGVLASEALDNALVAQPGNPLAKVFLTALRTAIPPTVIATMARSAVDEAIAELTALSEGT